MNQLENYGNNRDFKGAWIPKIIWIDTRLSGNDKVLLAEIDSLDNSIDHCFASNKYFADFLQVSTRTISRSISKLQELGYITVLGIDNNNNRHIKSNIRFFIDDEGIDKLSMAVTNHKFPDYMYGLVLPEFSFNNKKEQ